MASNLLDKKNCDTLKKHAAMASISVSVILCLLKFFGAFMTDSLAILSSMIDSLSDIFSSLITFIAIRYSTKPISCDHRYGYGKSEALSALAQSAFICGSGLFISYDALNRFIAPRPVSDSSLGLIIMGLSIIITLVLVTYQRSIAKITNSPAIKADRVHYNVDILCNISIIISLLTVHFWDLSWFDPLTALGLSSYLLYNAYKIAHDAIALLLDQELPLSVRAKIEKIVRAQNYVCGLHDLRTHDLGGCYMFELHLELDGNLPLHQAHEYSENIAQLIRQEFPNCEIIIHQDPVGIKEFRLDDTLGSCPRI